MGILNRIAQSHYSPTSLKEEALSRVPWPRISMHFYLKLHGLRPSVEFSNHDPFKIHWVDPDEITHTSENTRPVLWSTVKGGSWDCNTKRVADSPIFRSLEQHYFENIPWKKTPLYDEFRRTLRVEKAWGYRSIDQFEERTRDIENLVERIRKDGYKTQAEVIAESGSDSNDPVPPLLNEITVDIGRDGELLWRDFGQHRLSIAKLFDIDEVPVLVATRHKQWVEKDH